MGYTPFLDETFLKQLKKRTTAFWLIFTCSKSTIETLEKVANYVQS